MALITKPFTFSSGAVIVASEHNSNNDTIYNLVNGSISNANIDGSAAIADTKLAQITTASKVASSAVDGWKTGDWTLSSVTTARTGWTNVSGTHTGRFMRVNATPLSTGGSDTHTNAAGTHTHPVPNTGWSNDGTNATADQLTSHQVVGRMTANNTSGTPSAATGSGDNVPAFVQTVVFQRD